MYNEVARYMAIMTIAYQKMLFALCFLTSC